MPIANRGRKIVYLTVLRNLCVFGVFFHTDESFKDCIKSNHLKCISISKLHKISYKKTEYQSITNHDYINQAMVFSFLDQVYKNTLSDNYNVYPRLKVGFLLYFVKEL